MKHYFGIDFGTSNSSIAYMCTPDPSGAAPPSPGLISFPKQDGSGDPRLPSLVGLVASGQKRGKSLVGWEFIEKTWSRATETQKPVIPLLRQGTSLFRSVKSDLGSSRIYPFSRDKNIRVPEDAAAAILRGLLDEARLANPSLDPRAAPVVLSVPASLGAEARKETLASAAKAGLAPDQVSLIDEPIAALLHSLNDSATAAQLCPARTSRILVFDYGGGTLDLCLVECRRNPAAEFGFEIKHLAISSYRRNGGNDVDAAIMRKVLWPQVEGLLKMPKEHLRADIQRSIEDTLTCLAARPLKEMVCQKAERLLSRNGGDWDEVLDGDTEVLRSSLSFGHPGLPRRLRMAFEMSPRQFRDVMQPFLAIPDGGHASWESRFGASLFLPIFDTLAKAKTDVAQLDAVLLHGGACRNPWAIRAFGAVFARQDLFAHAKLVRTPDLNTSVAQGAALACYWRQGRGIDPVRPIIAEEVGIMAQGGTRITLVPAGECLPYPGDRPYWETGKWTFFVPEDNAPFMVVPWYTGPRGHPAHYVKVNLTGDAVKGEEVMIRLRIDSDKVLHWQYDIGGRGVHDAEAIEDPWQIAAPTPEEKKLAAHRRWMKQWALANPNQPVMLDMLATEANLCRLAGDAWGAEALCLDCLDHHGETSSVLNTLAIACAWNGKTAEALSYGGRAMELAPMDAVYVGNHGYCLADAGHRMEGENLMRKALAMDPTLVYLHERLGRLYLETGRKEEAEAVLSRGAELLRLGKAGGETRDNLATAARLYRHLGQTDQAKAADIRQEEMKRREIVGGDENRIIACYQSEGARAP